MSKIPYNKEDLADHHGVAAIIKDKDSKILVQEHIKYGFWTIPVGKVKEGQDIVDGLRQEILEECNINIINTKEIKVRDFYYERNNKNVCVTSHLFEILDYEGVVKNNEPRKHSQQIFLSIDQIMKLPYLSDMTLLYLEIFGLKRTPKI